MKTMNISSLQEIQEKANALGEKIKNTIPDKSKALDTDSELTKDLMGDEKSMTDKASITARADVKYDFRNKSLHGDFECYVNTVGGTMKGIGPNGRAAHAVMHYDPQDWYFYNGTPKDPCGIQLMGMLKTRSYFMIGTKIESSPPPPEEISKILRESNLDYMRDLNALGAGKGFAFGARVDMDTGDLKCLIFYGRLKLGAGFDLMLKNYGDKAICKHNGQAPGIDGWYANGQAYAYIKGDIGIRVRVFGRRKRIHILSIGAAALLQAQLPNPIWMRGMVGGDYKVLGGLVKGNCKFKFEAGKKCELDDGASVLDGIEIISDIAPEENKVDVDVFSSLQASFNYSVNKSFEIEELDGRKRTIRIKLVSANLMHDGKALDGKLVWNDSKDGIAFTTDDILPGESKIDYNIKLIFQELNGQIWTDIADQIEEKKGSFKTGKEPDFIPLSNIAYSYPCLNMFNYHKDETKFGYIKLKKGQPNLFKKDPKWDKKIRLISKTSQKSEFTNYQYSDRTIKFNMVEDLANNTVYKFEIVNLPLEKQAAVDDNMYTEEVGNDDLSIRNKKIDKSKQYIKVDEKILFTNHFRTSKFSKFKDKFKTIQKTAPIINPIYIGIYQTGFIFNIDECFGYSELKTDGTGLVCLEASNSNSWLKRINKLMYTDKEASKFLKRDTSLLGFKAYKAIEISQNLESERKIDSESFEGEDPDYEVDICNLQYNLAPIIFNDFVAFRNHMAAGKNVPGLSQNVLIDHFPFMTNGRYKLKVEYRLPGINKITFRDYLTFQYL
jgi:hypothetical protein